MQIDKSNNADSAAEVAAEDQIDELPGARHGYSEQNVVLHGVEKARGRYLSMRRSGGTFDVYYFDGKRWVEDDVERFRNYFLAEVIHDIQNTIERQVDSGALDDSAAREARQFSESLDSLSRRNRILEGIRLGIASPRTSLDPGSSPVRTTETDAALWLFNCENGTLNLRTGELQPHNPDDRITQLAPVEYTPEATCPTFDAMLERVLPDKAVREYVQEVAGYALNGTMRASVFPIMYGLGANGKSTLLNALRNVFGPDYSRMVPGYMFEHQNSSNRRHPTERVELKRRRFVMANETAENMRIDEQSVKEYTSSELINGRRLYSEAEEFNPTHTIFMQTNHPPKISGTDAGIWRRVREVRFDVEIPESERDPDIAMKLAAERAGILNWLLAGHQRWLDRGERFDTPEAVTRATDEYQAESNPLQQFVDDYFKLAPGLYLPSATIYDKYTTWAEAEGIRNPFTKVELVRRLKRQYKLEPAKRKGARGLAGIGLKDDGPGDGGPGDDLPPSFDKPPDPIAQATLHNTASAESEAKGAEGDATGGERYTGDIYVDVETTGLHPTEDRVRLLIAAEAGGPTHVFDMFNPAAKIAGLDWLEARREATFVAHFAQFDLAMLEGNFGYRHHGPVFCTNVASKIKHAGRKPAPAPDVITGYTKAGKPKTKKDSPHSLRSVVYRETGELISKDQQVSDWSAPELTDAQIEYAQGDVDVLPRVAQSLRDAIGHIGTVELDMTNVKIAARMAVRGVRFDVNAWSKLAEPHVEAIERIDKELDDLAAMALQGYGIDGPHNWNSAPQKKRLLECRGVKVPDTQADTLKRHAKADEAARLLAERAEHTKLATTYGLGFLDNVDSESRIRSTYGVYGAATGRFSSSGPNLQNIPREPEYRACFLPDEGHKFVIADWSQIEVRYIAAISEDKALQAALETGDVYEATAKSLLGQTIGTKAKISKEQRQLAKAVVLGFQYGLGVERFRDYALNTFNVVLTEAQARKYRDAFFAMYPRLRQWQREIGNGDLDAAAYEGSQTTTSRTYLGRVRYDLDKYTDRINTPIQAAGADALKLALARLYERGFDIALHVHDEVVVQAAPGEAERVKAELVEVMEGAALEAIEPDLRVPVPAEAAIGDSWADKA